MNGKAALRPGASVTVGRSRLRKAPPATQTISHLGFGLFKLQTRDLRSGKRLRAFIQRFRWAENEFAQVVPPPPLSHFLAGA